MAITTTPSQPVASSPAPAVKRQSPDSENTPSVKRQRQTYRRHHRLQKPLDLGNVSDIPGFDPSIDQQLNTSIGRILSDVGFEHTEPVVLNSLQTGVEEYMLHFISYVRQSMSSCRRIQPIPQDFEHALRSNSTSLDSLHPHLKPLQRSVPSTPPRPSSKKQPLPTPPPDESIPPRDFSFLGQELNSPEKKIKNSYIPKNFPDFPSKHTYQETPVYATKREPDPEKLRERATEEGRLGEEALRKLSRAAKDIHPGAVEKREKRLWGHKLENMDTMFEKTLKELVAKSKPVEKDKADKVNLDEKDVPSVSMPELGPIVNCERMYWRKFSAAKGPPPIQGRTGKNHAVKHEVE